MSNAKRVIIIHGTEGNPDRNWFPWLKEKLLTLSIETICPKFPTPENQSLNSWFDTLEKEIGEIKSTDMLIGHSTGAIFLVNLLNKLSHSVTATFLVAGFCSEIGIEKYDNLNKAFLNQKFNWQKIKENTGFLKIYSGSNDPYVPRNCSEELAKNLGVKEEVIENGGHLNSESGYLELNDLLESIMELLEL